MQRVSIEMIRAINLFSVNQTVCDNFKYTNFLKIKFCKKKTRNAVLLSNSKEGLLLRKLWLRVAAYEAIKSSLFNVTLHISAIVLKICQFEDLLKSLYQKRFFCPKWSKIVAQRVKKGSFAWTSYEQHYSYSKNLHE